MSTYETILLSFILLTLFVTVLSAFLLTRSLRRLEVEGKVVPNELLSLSNEVVSQKETIAAGFSQSRTEGAQLHTQLRGEISQNIREFGAGIQKQTADTNKLQRDSAEALDSRLRQISHTISEQMTAIGTSLDNRLSSMRESSEKSILGMRQTLDSKMNELRVENAKKLDQMRETVDEKLQSTLEKRLGESFSLVTKRLEEVHRGLGEMQTLASDVGGLKRVLTNVKVRGIYGEIQLGQLIEQVMTPAQYGTNVAVIPGSQSRVEYAIRLPGNEPEEPIWLPIDSKFPREDYERLVEAAEVADVAGVEAASKALEKRIKQSAKDIRDKYIVPPNTTDFAVMFLPTEGLYAEVARRPGLVEDLQRQFQVTVAGPTNLLAILNSLQMGFKTLAVQERGSEVWKVLGEAKSEFRKFGDVIDKVKKKIEQAGNCIDSVDVRTRAIEKKLREVEEVDYSAANAVEYLAEAGGGDE
ncbi:MAG: DNA recombination protein RmuC [Bacteroidetes Order II. Incertae sedis bacterium]|jgi:DNA recombination protein RmuC|nr:DNA recombination protein RmuC [Bacteroidetes Order II. bacterium]